MKISPRVYFNPLRLIRFWGLFQAPDYSSLPSSPINIILIIINFTLTFLNIGFKWANVEFVENISWHIGLRSCLLTSHKQEFLKTTIVIKLFSSMHLVDQTYIHSLCSTIFNFIFTHYSPSFQNTLWTY